MSKAGVASVPNERSLWGKVCGGFKSFFQWLSVKPVKPGIKGHPDYNPINTEKIKSEIRLEAEAERLGKADQPATDSVVTTGIESRIIQIIEKTRHDYAGWAVDRLSVLNQSINSIDISAQAKKVREADRTFENAADSILNKTGPTLKPLTESVQSLNAEMADFRRDNELRRGSNSPSKYMKFMLLTGLGLIITLEGVLNAFFFAQGNEYGLVGGFVNAVLFSLVNVAIAASLGAFGIRYKNHVSAPKRLMGYASIALAIIMALVISFMIAHYRDAMSHDIENATIAAWQNLLNNPFSLREVQSWLLFFFSNLFAMFAMWDGYCMDDPYPGYGKLTRRLEQARAAFNTEMDDIRLKLETLKNDTLSDIDASLKTIEVRLDKLSADIQYKSDTGAKLMTGFKDAENCLHTLLHTFRDTNRIHRQTPAPAFFNEWPQLREFEIPPYGVEQDKEKLRAQRTLLNQVQREIPRIRANIQSSYNTRHDSLTPLDVHFSQFKEFENYEQAKGI